MEWTCDEKRWKLGWKESEGDGSGSSRAQKERAAKI